MSGDQTWERITSATCFENHASNLGYTHIQTSTSLVETLFAMDAYEKYSDIHGVKAKRYHADNHRFAEKLFNVNLDNVNQTIIFCRVSSHRHKTILLKDKLAC